MFNKFEYVYAVYKAGNFTKAAESLYISQPSLSVAIKNIENKVGAALFERSGSGVKLTEVGKAYIVASENIIRIQHEFIDKINDIYQLETGEITVGGSNYMSSYILPRIVNRFTELYPKVKVTLVEGNSKDLQEMINNEDLDIVIDSFDEGMNIYDGYPLVKERILLCVPSKQEINNKLNDCKILPTDIYENKINIDIHPTVPIEVFKNEQFVLLKNGNDMYTRATQIFNKANIYPQVSFSVDQLNTSYALAESGMGCCFATDTLFRYGKFNNDVTLYKVSQEHGNRTLYIAHKKNKYRTRAMTEFIRIAKEVVN